MSRRKRTPEVDRAMVACFGFVGLELRTTACQVGVALSSHGGCGREWSDRQKRILAAMVLVKSCTLGQAEASLWLMLERNGVTGVDNPAWPDSAVFAAVCREYDDWQANEAAERRPKFRVLQGGVG